MLKRVSVSSPRPSVVHDESASATSFNSEQQQRRPRLSAPASTLETKKPELEGCFCKAKFVVFTSDLGLPPPQYLINVKGNPQCVNRMT